MGKLLHRKVLFLIGRSVRLIYNLNSRLGTRKKIQDKEIDPMMMATHRIKLEDLPLAYQRFGKKEDGIMGTFVETIEILRSIIYQGPVSQIHTLGEVSKQ